MASVSEILHDDELSVDASLVRALVDGAFPALAHLPLSRLASSGSTNVLFRLGPDLLVRLPRQPGDGATIGKEARWLPDVGAALPVAVPEVVGVGEPALGYPERWSIVRWLDGETPEVVGPEAPPDPRRRDLALDLAASIGALGGRDVPADALRDPALRWYRGDPLAAMDEDTRTNLEACRAIPDLGLDLEAIAAAWDEVMTLPGIDRAVEPRWYHGDLNAENLLVRNGRLTAVLDFGGLSVGDPTIDLLPAWEVLDVPARQVFRDAMRVDEATWLRGRGWALALALMTFPYYWSTMPARCQARLATVRSVLADR